MSSNSSSHSSDSGDDAEDDFNSGLGSASVFNPNQEAGHFEETSASDLSTKAREVSKKLGAKKSPTKSERLLASTAPVVLPSASKQFDTSTYRSFPPVPLSNPLNGSKKDGASYHTLNAQIEQYKEEIHRLQYYYSLAETSYNAEIVKLQCRINDQELAHVAKMEENRQLKLQLSAKTAECASLLKAKEAADNELNGIHEKARRDAYGTVLSQTRLIGMWY